MMNRGSRLILNHLLRAQGIRHAGVSSTSSSNLLKCSSCGCNFTRNKSLSNAEDTDMKREKKGASKYSTAAVARSKKSLSNPEDKFKYVEDNFISSLREKMGMTKYSPAVLGRSGFHLYFSAAEASRYNKLSEYLTLPDSWDTWHKLTSLHVWLVMTRIIHEGKESRIIKNAMIRTFIDDLRAKSAKIAKETGGSLIDHDTVDKLHEHFLASLISYDEGLLGSDKELASSVWRIMYNKKEYIDPTELEFMVKYIRKQVAHLQTIPRVKFVRFGLIAFLPVEGDIIDPAVYQWLDKVYNARL